MSLQKRSEGCSFFRAQVRQVNAFPCGVKRSYTHLKNHGVATLPRLSAVALAKEEPAEAMSHAIDNFPKGAKHNFRKEIVPKARFNNARREWFKRYSACRCIHAQFTLCTRRIHSACSLTTITQQLSTCLVIMAILSGNGCMLNRKKLNQNLTFPEQPYQDGITHSDEVLDELGPPLKMTALPHGYAFMYESLDTLELQLGFSLPIPVINWFKFVFAQADYDHQVLIYQFDDEHRLVASGGEDTHFNLGNSMAVQPILTVESMFDTSDVENEIVSFVEWPAFCLMPLPLTLNRAQSLDAGASGLEQRGTAPTVGQRSSEMHK